MRGIEANNVLWQLTFVLLTLWLSSPSDVWAQSGANDEFEAAIAPVNAETVGFEFPGPVDGTVRPVWVWRPRTSSQSRLPVLYMADGLTGLYVALLELKPAIDAGSVSPIMIVAIDAQPDPQDRVAEYLYGWPGGSDNFRAHEEWLLRDVIPWAERVQHASDRREQRFIGGFSNGGDLAFALASRHPDIFGGALVHSPVGAQTSWVDESSRQQRWVITGGTREGRGSLTRAGNLARQIVRALEEQNAPLRSCIGRWDHRGRYWRLLSPGSLVWLMGLGSPEVAESSFERGKCRNIEQH
ncbi:MAG: prolyl oligopeptidase family serine peptidase [Hyphomonadaceae bacterium]|nr:prolyl oligopeptidase family serine peptidase [Hyphomonadaceae bacterium]